VSEVKAFLLMLAIGNIVYAILMAGYLRIGTPHASMRVWTWAKAIEGCSYVVFWLRADVSSPFSVLLSNGLLIAAAVGQMTAYCMFLGYRWQHRLYALALVAELLFAAAVALQVPSPQLAVLMSLIIAVLAGLNAFILIGRRRDVAVLRWAIGIPNLLISLAFVARAYVGIIGGTLTVFSPGPTQMLIYLGAYLLLIVNGFGFLLLCKQKDERQLRTLATTDSLTGLINRYAFMDEAERAHSLAIRSQQALTLLMVDIDHFKQLNDRHGHAAGDHALFVFTRAAKRTLRKHDLMGRLGGEEFAVLLPGTAISEAVEAAERLRLAIAGATVEVADGRHSMTVSIGLAQVLDEETVSAALVRADRALYRAKRDGRNRVRVHAVHLATFAPEGVEATPASGCAI
jgi:diguanylate cyclase (GGDEF)-like protein